MLRLARFFFIAVTGFATLVASSLQGRVLCYADDGGHLALEAPHENLAHRGHDHGRDAGRVSTEVATSHDPHQNGCTDVSAAFSVMRDGSRAVADHHHAELTLTSTLSSVYLVTPISYQVRQLDNAYPPATSPLSCLRTIVLLA